MAVKSVFVSGKICEEFSKNIWEPETDIRSGVWAISLQKVVIKLSKDVKKQFSFCVKTNLVDQNERDVYGNLKVIKTCLGLFSIKGNGEDEIVIQNNNAQFFTITRPDNELIVIVDKPLTNDTFKPPSAPTEKAHELGCYFVYKRLI